MIAFSKPCCLVAEDQALIALALEAALEEVGIGIAGPFPSSAEALAWGEEHTPELALLDFKLRDGPGHTLVTALLGRGVPAIIASGCPQGPGTWPKLCDVIWLEKLLDPARLL